MEKELFYLIMEIDMKDILKEIKQKVKAYFIIVMEIDMKGKLKII